MVLEMQLVDQRPGISITRKPVRLANSWSPPSPTNQTLRLGPATYAPTNLPRYFSTCSRLRITSIGKAGQKRNERKVKSAESSKVSEP